jgi:NAD(P)-dependent dehydrogenase (short-subunit alcohol dehydrogenase family)
MEREFLHRVMVVAGGAQGIGRACSERLAQGGAAVAILDRDPAGAEVAQNIVQAGGDALFVSTELTDSQRVAQAFATVKSRWGGVDGLVFSAGIQRYGTVADTPESLWDEVMAVNVKSAYLTSHYAVLSMLERGGGAIVLVASVQALANQSRVAAYAASKGALVSLTRAMAVDHARQGIRVNAIAPGSVDTPMLRSSARLFAKPGEEEAMIAAWGQSHPIGRVAQPREVAEVAAFLLSDRASFVTGSVYPVDGGLLAQIGVVLPDDGTDHA